MEQRKVCCLVSSVWAIAIALSDLIVSVLLCALWSVYVALGVEPEKYACQTSNHGYGGSATSTYTTWITDQYRANTMLLIYVMMFVLETISVVLAIIFILGAFQRNARFIYAWMVFKVLYFLCSRMALLVLSVLSPAWHITSALVSLFVIGLPVYWFVLWVVGIHKKEIQTIPSKPDVNCFEENSVPDGPMKLQSL